MKAEYTIRLDNRKIERWSLPNKYIDAMVALHNSVGYFKASYDIERGKERLSAVRIRPNDISTCSPEMLRLWNIISKYKGKKSKLTFSIRFA